MRPIQTVLTAATLILFVTAIGPARAIGLDEREAAENVPHTLRLEFAQPDGHYLGGIETSVTDKSGKEILSVRCPGPWVLLNLPDGRYSVSAGFEGKTVTRKVTIRGGKRQKQVFIF
jgi:hypothetical protein